MNFEILFEDNHLLVLSKPAGLLSQSDISGEKSLVDLLRDYFGRHYVGLIHRLDRNTSGLMVIGKRSKSANRLTESLQKGNLKRAYSAWVLGDVKSELNLVHYLLKNEETNTMKSVKQNTPGSKIAKLKMSPIRKSSLQGEPLTLVRVELETGRSHQIRIQSALEGHPLLGEAKYALLSPSQKMPRFHRPALHSSELSFPHPMSGEIMNFQSPLPRDLVL